MKKAAKSSGKKTGTRKSSKRTVTVEADAMPVEEVPEVQAHEATSPEPAVAEEPRLTKAKRRPTLATSGAKDGAPALKPLSCLDAAAAILADRGTPMRTKDLIDLMASAGLWTSNAPTPAATLYSAILREITVQGEKSRFKKTDRGHFALNA